MSMDTSNRFAILYKEDRNSQKKQGQGQKKANLHRINLPLHKVGKKNRNNREKEVLSKIQ